MANNEQDKKISAAGAGYNKMNLSLKVKEEMLVFPEKPKLSAGEVFEQRKGAHELFSLFTANIIKNKALFVR